jgi:hypothetical protein
LPGLARLYKKKDATKSRTPPVSLYLVICLLDIMSP